MNSPLNDPTNQNSLKSPKLINQQIRKRYYKTLGTSIINSLSLEFETIQKWSHTTRKNIAISFVLMCRKRFRIVNILTATILQITTIIPKHMTNNIFYTYNVCVTFWLIDWYILFDTCFKLDIKQFHIIK